MTKKIRIFVFVVWAALGVNFAMAQSPGHAGLYGESQRYLLAPSDVFDLGMLGAYNPATLAFVKRPELRLYWSNSLWEARSNWGASFAGKLFGFNYDRWDLDRKKLLPGEYTAGYPNRIERYQFNVAGGNPRFAFGIGYRRVKNPMYLMPYRSGWLAGLIGRPNRFLTVGASFFRWKATGGETGNEGLLDFGIRPLGTPALTLFADLGLSRNTTLRNSPWSAGFVLHSKAGLSLALRYFDDHSLQIGLSADLGRFGFRSLFHRGSGGSRDYATHVIRIGRMLESKAPALFQKSKFFVPFELRGKIDYHRFVFFDKSTHPFFPLLQDIRAAAEDPRVGLIAVNLSSVQVGAELAWEIRRALLDARSSGKRVLAYVDNAGMTLYHLASAADWIVMDPEGILTLPGYLMGQTYFKGTLEKLGLGFDEWRFFRYKSALEVLSRKKMSKADREQRQAYLDDYYETVRNEIAAGRKLSPSEMDSLIDSEMAILAATAKEKGLVDTLARWSSIDKVIAKLAGEKKKKMSRKVLLPKIVERDDWGEKPKIAVVYGLGVCAMDQGIRARWLEGVFRKLAEREDVRAVVFRVDSPGGEAMASDVVAEAIKFCSKKKPVVVSQGQVAGSGGYWISMYGDTILASPLTITGSIGVIGGWIYDKGFSGKLGFSEDHVYRGRHADLGAGIQIPFLGTLPSRNLTPEEREKIRGLFLQFYDEFVEKVAAGRGLSEEHVRQIAEGHFYSGIDGKAVGLVDELGGLLEAIAVAKQMAGISAGQRVEYLELPRSKGLFNLQISPFGTKTLESGPAWQYLRLIAESKGRPLPLLPVEFWPVLGF